MEFWLLAKIGMYIGIAEKVGYGVVATYFGATALRFVQDYKNSVEEEEVLGGNKDGI